MLLWLPGSGWAKPPKLKLHDVKVIAKAAAREEAITLTEEQALALFYQRNLSIIAAHYNVEQAKAQQIIAAAIPNPMFNFTVAEISPQVRNFGNLRGDGPAFTSVFSQLFETAGKRRFRIESAEFGRQASEQDLQDALRTFTNALRRTFYGLLLAQKTVDLAQDNLQRYQEIVRVNRLRLQSGDISESDLLRIETESLKVQSDVDTAMASLKQARSDLAVLLGWPKDALNFRAQDTWPEPKELGQSEEAEGLLQEALQHRPDLQAARIRIEQAEKNLKLARALRTPDVTASAGYAHDPSNNRDNTALLGIQVELPLFYRKKGEIDQAVVGLNTAQLQVMQAEQSIRADIVSALAAWKSTSAVTQRFREQILARVTKVRDTVELSYREGATSILDLIEAQRTYRAVMLDYFNALYNRTIAYADLIKATGVELRQ